ncbi:hypothetical protein J3A83DRAFT_4087910, partial [Scleroderma citrinum]
QLFSAERPFKDVNSNSLVLPRIREGPLPDRPARITDEWWELCISCWKEPASRPTMSALVERIEKLGVLMPGMTLL